MAYKITDERKKEIVNVIAEITTELKKFEEVECIAWRTIKEETFIMNLLDVFKGNFNFERNTNTGNYLKIIVITKEKDIKNGLRSAIFEMTKKYNTREMQEKTGVDLVIHDHCKDRYPVFSEEDRKKANTLLNMLYSDVIIRENVIKFINEKVYKGSKTVKEYCDSYPFNGVSKKLKIKTRYIISGVLFEMYDGFDYIRFLNRSHIIYDKTPDGYYKKVSNQFTGNIEPKVADTLLLNIGIDDELKLKLESNN